MKICLYYQKSFLTLQKMIYINFIVLYFCQTVLYLKVNVSISLPPPPNNIIHTIKSTN